MYPIQEKLYNQLMTIVEADEAFFFSDQTLEGSTFRIFNYRMASYMDFMLPGALECRGIMFEMIDDVPIDLVSRPMTKFFNLNENPLTMDLDLTTAYSVELKADGSLISSYLHCADEGKDNVVRLKSKGSLASDQALASMVWLNKPENTMLRTAIHTLATQSYTVNMEWCAPDNRIVIGYPTAHLVILNIRCNITGRYIGLDDLPVLTTTQYNAIEKHWILQLEIEDPVDFVNRIPDMDTVEGYIVRLLDKDNNDLWVKIKTLWYLTQHRAKDSINSDRRLYETVLAEATDDLRTLFHDDPLVIERIEWMEAKVEKIYNHIVDTVERYYERNKEMIRKDFAILGKKELTNHEFSLAMSKYVGRDVNYKEYLAKKWKDFGIKDDPDAK